MPKTAMKASPPHARPTNKAGGSSTLPTPTTNPATSLPTSLVNALPVSKEIIKHVQAIEAAIPQLEKELKGAERAGAIQLARAFVVLHRMYERLGSEEKAFKPFKSLFKDFKELHLPHAFEVDGVTNVPLAEGFRVGVAYNTRASMKPDQKGAAYDWLQEHYPDIIQPVVNASTLSKLAKELGEENKELPEDRFTVALMPTTSVTKT